MNYNLISVSTRIPVNFYFSVFLFMYVCTCMCMCVWMYKRIMKRYFRLRFYLSNMCYRPLSLEVRRLSTQEIFDLFLNHFQTILRRTLYGKSVRKCDIIQVINVTAVSSSINGVKEFKSSWPHCAKYIQGAHSQMSNG